MTDAIANIEERRFAFLELNFIVNHIKTKYGENPPMEIRNTLSELAAIYKKKYGASSDKAKDNGELQSFASGMARP